MDSRPHIGTVTFRGKEFPVVYSSIIMEQEPVPKLGIVMDTVIMKCTMIVKRRWRRARPCSAWIELLLEFVPSAWFCPACSGLMVVDHTARRSHYTDAGHLILETWPKSWSSR